MRRPRTLQALSALDPDPARAGGGSGLSGCLGRSQRPPASALSEAWQGSWPRSPVDELVEAALAAVGRLVLVQKCQFVLVEDLEELVPVNFFEIFLGLAEVDAQNAALAAGIDLGGMSAAGFCPFANLVVIGRGV